MKLLLQDPSTKHLEGFFDEDCLEEEKIRVNEKDEIPP